ncbi:MAG: hypothetical protein GX837_04910 [Methanomicrobiales archaeon]|jgi:hypothetical protein|nr:hypothetical protein [Methanomicrobiales archaeon]
MRKLSIYLIFVAIWVIGAVAVATFPGLMAPAAGVFMLTLDEVVALFLSAMVILTMIFLALIGFETGRFVAEHLR